MRRTETLAQIKHCAIAQLAVAWVLNQGMNVFALLSCTSIAHIEGNAAAADMSLTAKECAWLNLESDSR